MVRRSNWQSQLSAYLIQTAERRFSYARGFDCGTFVAGAIESMTGVDVALSLRDNKYTNRTEAFAAIEALCGSPTMEAVAAFIATSHGIPEVPVLCAQRGDAVVLKSGRRSTLGIVAMHGTEVLTPYKDGILRVPIEHANITHAYHI